MKLNFLTAVTSVFALTLLTACGSETIKSNDAEVAIETNNQDLYEVHHDGRIHIFDDRAVYESYLEVGETSYRQVRIGAGPKGETIVFGLTSEDKKKTSGIAAADMYDGNLKGATPFYGEMRIEGRIYVFGSLDEMNDARIVGEVPLRYTDIGSGPKGETVVYALNGDNKKVKPVGMIELFKKMNDM